MGNDVEVYSLESVAGSPRVARYRFLEDDWTILPAIVDHSIDNCSIQVSTRDGRTRVYVAAWDQTIAGDHLFVSENTGTTSWNWWRLHQGGGDPFSGMSYQLHGLTRSSRQTIMSSTLLDDLWYTAQDGTEIDNCVVPATLPSTTASATCAPYNNYVVPDWVPQSDEQRVGSDVIGPAIYASDAWVYTPGTLRNAEYLFGQTFNAGPPSGGWANFLALRSATMILPDGTNTTEFAAVESHGLLAVSAVHSKTWVSSDDGSTWLSTEPMAGSGHASTDQNLAISANDTLHFVTATGLLQPVYISQFNTATNTWSTPVAIPPTQTTGSAGNLVDRPWFAMDRGQGNRGYLVWSTGTGANQARFAYCDATTNCAVAASWCGNSAWTLPTSSGCTGTPGSPGCSVVVSGLGRVWFTIKDDTGCPPNPTGYSARLGLRYLTNSLSSSCTVAPQLSTPECFYYVDNPPSVTTQVQTAAPGTRAVGPGQDQRFSVVAAPASDSDSIALSIQGYRDLDGGICTSSSTRCRAEIYTFRRRAADFNSCGSPPCSTNLSSALLANRDQNIGGGGLLPWVSHIHPQVAFLDGDRVVASWMDFRNDPSDLTYAIGMNAMSFSGGSLSAASHAEALWSSYSPATYFYAAETTGAGFGDVHVAAYSRQHLHLTYPIGQSSLYTSAVTMIWSRESPHE